MPDPVLIAYDGSDRSRRAITAVAGLIDPGEAVVLHVAELAVPTPSIAGIPEFPAHGLESQPALEEHAQRVAEEGAELAKVAGFTARGRSIVTPGGGAVADAITSAADEIDASLIVIGSHGHGVIRAALLGSVSAGVLSRTARPVLVVPAHD